MSTSGFFAKKFLLTIFSLNKGCVSFSIFKLKNNFLLEESLQSSVCVLGLQYYVRIFYCRCFFDVIVRAM